MPKTPKKQYDRLNFRLARWEERETIIDFINANFDWKLPLVNRREFFEHYYVGDRLQFAIAEQDDALVSVAGYILANHSDTPDIWVSVWVAEKGANGVGLELMNAIPSLTGAKVVACNNIRENTCVFYRFLGWSAERLPHYYRLSEAAASGNARLCRPGDAPVRLPATGDLTLDKVSTSIRLRGLGMPVCHAPKHTPAKDIAYLQQRYFSFPHLAYDVWSVHETGALRAYLITRTVQSGDSPTDAIPVLRIVDFIGDDSILPRIGGAIDALMQREGAEYADCYCAGIPEELFAAAGFCARTADDNVMIPNYLTPPLYENTEYFYFTNAPEGFTMFKADGDQDRPNLPVD